MIVGQTPEFGSYEGAFSYLNGAVWGKALTFPAMAPMASVLSTHLHKTGTSDQNMVVNGSVTPVIFEYEVPADKYLLLSQINIIIVDGSITATKFGGLPALTNGILWQIVDESSVVTYSFGAGDPIKANYEFYNISGTAIDLTGAADVISINWSSAGIGFTGVVANGHKVRVTIRDNMAGLDAMQASLQGILVPSDVVFAY